MNKIRLLCGGLLAFTLISVLVASQAAAAHERLVRTEWPSAEDLGMPFYARVELLPPYIFNDGEWAAIVFYRHPSCVPPDFNLITVFDVPGAFTCPHTVNGMSLWHREPFNGAPKIIHISGNGAVPVWFVPWDAVKDQAHAGGNLTVADLEQIPGRLVGFASQYTEELQPHPDPNFGGGGHQIPKMIVHAHGKLVDGRDFKLFIAWVRDEVRGVRIQFK